MAKHIVSERLRAMTSTTVLAALLVGGTVGIATVASHLSGEIGRADLSAQTPPAAIAVPRQAHLVSRPQAATTNDT